MFRIGVALAILCLVPPSPAGAACTDPAAPGVEWRRCYHDGRSLVGVDLTEAMLRDATFQRSDLSRVNLSGASGFRAKLISTTMAGAILDRSVFSEADFTKADLTGASLRDADVRRARFYHAILRGADLTGLRMDGADLSEADLSGATWIDGKRLCAQGSIGQCN
ncbi:MAG: pentapeptide repeat-containing protein [Alphaproteobacteria bacterium]|nr:pentapeptide repeat-containing protein [Alphaproteobacteria bacterium]MBF0128900.1 pentapeptide repeat-containing protein [Alphaproteobacteria bacterium]